MKKAVHDVFGGLGALLTFVYGHTEIDGMDRVDFELICGHVFIASQSPTAHFREFRVACNQGPIYLNGVPRLMKTSDATS